MSERKVLNKYFPPDFDPSKIPRRRMPKDKQQVVRLMAPFSMRCNLCGEYIYKGKKFNARKETVDGETYYGIKIFRFYIKCTRCSAEITFRTDPKNTDYLAEHGASRNFEKWRNETAEEEEDKLAKLEEEEDNPMKALENRTVDSKREMDILDKLQEIRHRNARIDKGNVEKVLERVSTRTDAGDDEESVKRKWEEEERRRWEEEDEEEVRRVFAKVDKGESFQPPSIELDEPVGNDEEDEEEEDSGPVAGPSSSSKPSSSSTARPTPASADPSASRETTTTTTAAARPGPSIKRKLDIDAPDPSQLLSESARKVIASAKADFSKRPSNINKAPAGSKSGIASLLGGAIKKRKTDDMAAKLGIKVIPKTQAKTG